MTILAEPETFLTTVLVDRIRSEARRMAEQYAQTPGGARVCWIDDLLPPELFESLAADLPEADDMIRRKSLKERKSVTARLEVIPPRLRNVVLALNSEPVLRAVADALGLRTLERDAKLYNGGVTVLQPGDFTRPHLDNSHDLAGQRRRALVALFYFAPQWRIADGGHLTLLQTRRQGRRVDYRPNRLVFMETSETSWHSVGVVTGRRPRLNTATYYYHAASRERERPRLTRFRDWTASPLDVVLEADFQMRELAQRLGLRRFAPSRHVAQPARPAAQG